MFKKKKPNSYKDKDLERELTDEEVRLSHNSMCLNYIEKDYFLVKVLLGQEQEP